MPIKFYFFFKIYTTLFIALLLQKAFALAISDILYPRSFPKPFCVFLSILSTFVDISSNNCFCFINCMHLKKLIYTFVHTFNITPEISYSVCTYSTRLIIFDWSVKTIPASYIMSIRLSIPSIAL